MGTNAKLRSALEAAEHWLAEEAASSGQTRPDEILRVIREALAVPADPVEAAAPDLLAALKLVRANAGAGLGIDDRALDALDAAIAKSEGRS